MPGGASEAVVGRMIDFRLEFSQLTIWMPGGASEAVVGRVIDFRFEFSSFRVPNPQLGRIFGTTNDHKLVVRRPSQVRHAVGVT